MEKNRAQAGAPGALPAVVPEGSAICGACTGIWCSRSASVTGVSFRRQ